MAKLVFDVSGGPIAVNIIDDLEMDESVVMDIAGGESKSDKVTLNLLQAGKLVSW